MSARLAARFLTLIREQGLTPDQVALMVLSRRYRSVLVQHRATEPMPAASNTKLVTAYAALRALTPNFRWRTRVSRIAEHDGAAGTARQGLLIEGSGDPTLVFADLEEIAQRLRAAGVRRMTGGLYLDESLYGTGTAGRPGSEAAAVEREPADLPEDADEPIREEDDLRISPPSAFVVEHNAPTFLLALPEGGGIEIISRLPGEALRTVSRLQPSATRRSAVRVEQTWGDAVPVVTFGGTLAPGIHTLTVPVAQPAPFFAHLLRAALRRNGIEGDLPLRPALAPTARRELLFSHFSPPLREAIGPMLKDSDNLAADGLLWTLSAQARSAEREGPLELEEGLRWVRRIVQQDFPGIQNEVELNDGSGLNADSRISARALARVLNGALGRAEFGPEFESALSRAGWDGTLRYRNYPPILQGRLRAKTGTLAGVQNLTGVLPLNQDEVVFAFLISAPGLSRTRLQAAQDHTLAELHTLLRKEEIRVQESDPLAPPALSPPPASHKPGRKKSLKPPSPSPKPKVEGGSSQSGVS
jgi:D-alanyl-D-alanine carboxypeptidase/D-alanyl-D-alanine-endopeptidase (penicillin-binding protein 4)